MERRISDAASWKTYCLCWIMFWCSCTDTLRDTDQPFKNHDFMSVELCNFILVKALAHCSNSSGMECVLISVSIPWETQPLWLLRCLLFPPSPTAIFISIHLLFHALKSMTLHHFAVPWDMAPDFRHVYRFREKRPDLSHFIATCSEVLFHPPGTDAALQSLTCFAGALSAYTRLWGYWSGQDLLLLVSPAFSQGVCFPSCFFRMPCPLKIF